MSVENESSGEWNLVYRCGGKRPCNTFDKGQYVWVFTNDQITIPEDDGGKTTYSYYIETVEGETKIFRDGHYFGNILLQTQDSLIIDQNKYIGCGMHYLLVK